MLVEGVRLLGQEVVGRTDLILLRRLVAGRRCFGNAGQMVIAQLVLPEGLPEGLLEGP